MSMKKFKLIPLFLLLAMLFVPSTVAKAAPNKNTVAAVTSTQTYSTWLWNTYEITYNSDNLLNFLVANNVTDVQLQVNYDIDYAYYQDFISRAAANNIAVHALEGSPDWVMPDGSISQNAFFAWLADYQANSTPEARFKGIHLGTHGDGRRLQRAPPACRTVIRVNTGNRASFIGHLFTPAALFWPPPAEKKRATTPATRRGVRGVT